MTAKTNATQTISEKWVVAFQVDREEPFDSFLPEASFDARPGARTAAANSAKRFETREAAIDEALRIRSESPTCLARAACVRLVLDVVDADTHLDRIVSGAFVL